MRSMLSLAVVALLLPMLSLSTLSEAAATTIRGKFSFDGIANCDNPPIRGFPIHGEGTAALSSDRSATVDMDSNVEGRVEINAKLGGKPTEAPGSLASLHVAGRHTLRAVRDYPNNYFVVYLKLIGNSCKMRIENRLKPGKRQYTFYTGSGFVYCPKPQIVRTECTPIQ